RRGLRPRADRRRLSSRPHVTHPDPLRMEAPAAPRHPARRQRRMAPVCVVSQLIEKSKMQLTRLLAAVGLSLVLAAPVMTQTTSPRVPQSSPTATKPDAATNLQPSPGLVDINSASAEELRKLRGIGPMRVNAIIAHP